MIKINLISKTDIENLKWEKINKAVVCYFSKVIIIEAVFAAFLLGAIFYLDFERNKSKEATAAVESTKENVEIKKMEDSLKRHEKNLKVVTSINQNHISWNAVIDAFSNIIVTEGIKLNVIKFQPFEIESKDDKRRNKKVVMDETKLILKIEGIALKREDLMIFEKKLGGSGVFKMIETADPSYNKYVNSENISFRFDFEVLREDLAKLASDLN